MTTSSNTQRYGPALFVSLNAMVFAQVDGRAQTVVNRARIGGYAEDIVFVTSGPLRNDLVGMI